jgi:hypothetical protein
MHHSITLLYPRTRSRYQLIIQANPVPSLSYSSIHPSIHPTTRCPALYVQRSITHRTREYIHLNQSFTDTKSLAQINPHTLQSAFPASLLTSTSPPPLFVNAITSSQLIRPIKHTSTAAPKSKPRCLCCLSDSCHPHIPADAENVQEGEEHQPATGAKRLNSPASAAATALRR